MPVMMPALKQALRHQVGLVLCGYYGEEDSHGGPGGSCGGQDGPGGPTRVNLKVVWGLGRGW
jgi:hypothetical protein